MIDEFVAVWQWKPEGKLTEDELTLKADGFLFLKREGQAAAGTWNVAEPKGRRPELGEDQALRDWASVKELSLRKPYPISFRVEAC